MNLGENNNFFRESFRGFNKDDVAEYIAKLSKDYAANEDKYKEHISKLTLELKEKTDEFNNFAEGREDGDRSAELDEIERKYKDEISRLSLELEEKDLKINALYEQSGAETDGLSELDAEEIAKYQETINILSKEIEKLRDKFEKANTEQSEQSAETVNQLSFQLAESESEKLFLLNLLKKFISVLDIDCARDKNIEYAANISDIAPKSVVAEEISAGLATLAEYREKAAALEAEVMELKEKTEENQAVLTTEQQMYETITANLGEVIYSAKKAAEEITVKARADAEDIIGSARRDAAEIIDRATEDGAALLVKNRENMAVFREKYGFIKREHEEMVRKYKEISELYALCMSEIDNTVTAIYNSVSD